MKAPGGVFLAFFSCAFLSPASTDRIVEALKQGHAVLIQTDPAKRKVAGPSRIAQERRREPQLHAINEGEDSGRASSRGSEGIANRRTEIFGWLEPDRRHVRLRRCYVDRFQRHRSHGPGNRDRTRGADPKYSRHRGHASNDPLWPLEICGRPGTILPRPRMQKCGRFRPARLLLGRFQPESRQ